MTSSHGFRSGRKVNDRTNDRGRRKPWRRLLVAAGSAAALLAGNVGNVGQGTAWAGSFYWTGKNSANGYAWNNTGAAGTNWSTVSSFINDPGTLPGPGDDVFFYALALVNDPASLNTTLGQNFTINSLNFTPGATEAVTIGGANTLTLNAGGLTVNSGAAGPTLNANVTLGAAQTWTNNGGANVLTVNGQLGGSAAWTIAGAGNTVLTNVNPFSGSVNVSTNGAALTLASGPSTSGSLLSISSMTVGGGATLTLDSTTANSTTGRLAAALPVTLAGGTLALNGNGSAATSETVGTLTLGSGASSVVVNPGSGQAATLTFGSASLNSFSRTAAGQVVNFAPSGTIAAPKVTLDAGGLIGGWATVGNPNSNSAANTFDFATVSGGNVVAASNYVNNNAQADFVAGNNVKVSNQVTLGNATQTVNSLYLTGNAQLNFGTGATGTAQSTNTLVISSGAILSNAATKTTGFNNQPDLTTTALIGSAPITGGATGVAGGPTFQGRITSGNGADLIVYTASNLQLNSIITNNGSTPIGLTKNGSGTLDLSDGNEQGQPNNGSPAISEIANTYTGITTINAGTVLVNDDQNLGAVPGSFVANQLTLNGGTLLTTRGFSFAANRGITVGPQGGTLAYEGGATWTITQKIAGAGGITFSSQPAGFSNGNSNTVVISSPSNGNTYSGATVLNTASPSGQTAVIRFGGSNVIPSGSAVTLTGNPHGTATTAGVDMNGTTQVVGSLASAVTVSNIYNGNTGTAYSLTLGGNNLSTSYAGAIGGNGSVTKVGTGTQTFAGPMTYTGNTNINGGSLLVTGSQTAAAATFNVGNAAGTTTGSLGGSGTIAAPVIVNSAGHLAPAVGGKPSTLTVNNNLTLSAGATLDFTLNTPGSGATAVGASNDQVVVGGAGNLTLNSGADTLNVIDAGSLGIGTYNLLSIAGTGTGTFSDLATFTINGSTKFNYVVLTPGQLIDASAGGGTVPAKTLMLEVLQGNPNLIWTGATNGTWDTTTANWTGDSAVFGNGSNVTFDDTATGTTSVSVAGGVGVSPNSVVINNNAKTYTFSGGPVTVTAGAGVTKNGTGTAVLNNAWTSPAVVINNGTITVGATGTLTSPSLNVTASTTLNVAGALGATTGLLANGTVNFTNAAQSLATLSNSAGVTSGVVNLTGTGTTPTALTVTGSSAYAGAIQGAGSLSKGTGGTFVDSGPASFTGGGTVSAGTLEFTNNANTLSGNYAVSGTGVLATTANSAAANNGNFGAATVTLAGGTLGLDSTSPTNAGFTFDPATQVSITSSSTINAFGTGTGTITLGSATHGFAAPAGSTLALTNTGSGTLSVPGVISGAASVSATSGTLVLNGANTFSGSVTATGGLIQAGNKSAFGAATGTATSSLVLNGGTVGSTVSLTGANAVANAVSFGANNSGTIDDTNPLELSGPVALGTGTTKALTVSGPNNFNVTLSGPITGSAGMSLTGFFSVTNTANSFTGNLQVNGGTSIRIPAAGALGGSTILFSNGGFETTAASLTGANAIPNAFTWNTTQPGYVNGTNPIEFSHAADLGAGGTFTMQRGFNVTAAGGTAVFSGVLSGAAGFVVGGAGTTVFTAAETYTGTTTVNSGTLLVGSAAAPASIAGPAVVNATSGAPATIGTLGGNGTLSGTLTVTGGTVAPGNSTGSTVAGNLTVKGAATFAAAPAVSPNPTVPATLSVGINAASANQLVIASTGSLTLTTANLALTSFGSAPAAQVYVLVDNASGELASAVGTFGTVTYNGTAVTPTASGYNLGGSTYNLVYNYDVEGHTGNSGNGNDIALVQTPEPAGTALLGLAAVGLLARRRRT